jgi:hypothetical protein
VNRRAHRIPHSTLRFRNLAAASLALGAVLTLSACSSSGGDSKASAKTSPPATSTSTDPAQEAGQAALTAWTGMRTEEIKASQTGYVTKTRLSDYSYDKAMSKTKVALFNYRQQGVVFKGTPTSTFKVTSIDVHEPRPTVKMWECLDTSNWKPVLKESGKDVATDGQVRRFVITGVVVDLGDRWMVQDYTLHRDQKC